jgi:hypothetical protein
MSQLVKNTKKLKKLIVKNFWEKELNNSSFHKIKDSFDLESLTLEMGKNYNWKQIFPYASQTIVKRPSTNERYRDDQIFKKVLKMKAGTMIRQRIFAPKLVPKGYYDPMLRLPEKIHNLMLQHLCVSDILNMFEVSKTWNNYLKVSDLCASHTILYLKHTLSADDLTVMRKSTRKFTNLITDFYQPKMIKCFSNLRRLAITFHVVAEFMPCDEFPHLECLIIVKCPAKLYNHENILLCLDQFAKCKTLTSLEICEAITCENYELFWEMLANNHKLKFLKVHQCSEFFYLFSEDFSHRIHFQLEHFDYRIPQKFSIVGSNFEQNCARFLKKQKSLKIVDFNLCSAVMLNEVFRLPIVHTVRMLRITGYDHVMLEKNYNIKEFVFPNTPQLYVLNSNQSFDFKPFLEAVPNVELLFVFSLTSEILLYAARNLKHVKYLTAERFNGFDVEKTYKKLIYRNEKEIVNSSMRVYKTRFNLINTEERSFERIFGTRKVR